MRTPLRYIDEQMTDARTYRVQGMSCEHCVRAVTLELLATPGVAAVDVDLALGRVVVTGTALDDDAVRAAVDEAGYEVVA
jgi:copper chaperone CopZ